jgi:hypothetical protein
VKPRLHGPDRPVDDLRDLLVALAPFVEQNEDLAIISAERIYRGADLGPQFNRIIGRALIGGFVQVVRELWPLCTSNHPGSATIHRNPKYPRAKKAFRVPTT